MVSDTDRKLQLPRPFSTTGIGSLPHHNVDAALEFAFRFDVPFLPQIPVRNPWEYMVAQALEGLPGFQIEKDGSSSLDADVWLGRYHVFNERLLNAFSATSRLTAFETFEPSSASSSSWQAFLWELSERGVKTAKVQLAGPLTSQWVLRLTDGSSADRSPDIAAQIYRLVLARAMGMCRRLQAEGIQPILYLDEPGLYGISRQNPRHALGWQELRLMVQALKKEGVFVGIHCCSNTDWRALLGSGIDILSIDAHLSLAALLAEKPAVEEFVRGGGRLSLGVIPTSRDQRPEGLSVEKLFHATLELIENTWPDHTAFISELMTSAIFTPACGLALHTPKDSENILAVLNAFREQVAKRFSL